MPSPQKITLLASLITVLILIHPAPLLADVPPAQQHEVAHLLLFVGKSSCSLIRNGSSHQGNDAAAHIKQKYDYFRGKIKTTEQFIELAASKSSSSGKEYRVSCPGEPQISSRDWLMAELGRYRRQPR